MTPSPGSHIWCVRWEKRQHEERTAGVFHYRENPVEERCNTDTTPLSVSAEELHHLQYPIMILISTAGQTHQDTVHCQWPSVIRNNGPLNFQCHCTTQEVCSRVIPFSATPLLHFVSEGNIPHFTACYCNKPAACKVITISLTFCNIKEFSCIQLMNADWMLVRQYRGSDCGGWRLTCQRLVSHGVVFCACF